MPRLSYLFYNCTALLCISVHCISTQSALFLATGSVNENPVLILSVIIWGFVVLAPGAIDKQSSMYYDTHCLLFANYSNELFVRIFIMHFQGNIDDLLFRMHKTFCIIHFIVNSKKCLTISNNIVPKCYISTTFVLNNQ